ncbi:MAG: hypothetical protein HZB47_12910 [Nitrosomonadales bacterium]|nr:hypothetical protein [Nitrosomonadales bacterium]
MQQTCLRNPQWMSVRSVVIVTAMLAGCGGGGAANTSTPPSVVTYPATGTYSWTLPVRGALTAPTMGLSFVHPGDTSIEYVIEPAAAAISDVKEVSSGTVTVGGQTLSNIKPDSLLYIVAGEVRRIPLLANGIAPATQVKKTANISACKFVVAANDYAAPDQSRYIVSTKGTDGACGTADDGQSEIVLGVSGGVSSASVLNTVLGVLHDDATLVPRGWVLGDGIFWRSPDSFMVMRVNTDPLITKVVAGNYKALVAEYNNQLTVWQVSSAPAATETKLNAAVTAGTGWKSMGYDASNFYVYRNSGAACPGATSWTVLKISIASPAATQLASGAGCIASADMGTAVLYASVLGASANTLLSMDKNAAGTPQTVKSVTASDFVGILTSASGIHQMWYVYGLSSPWIEMIDEAGTRIKLIASGFPMAVQDAATVNLNISENRKRFIYANGYSGSMAFGNSTIEVFDAASQTTTAMGTISGFGTSPVFASVSSSASDFIGGVAVPFNSGTGALDESLTKVFSLDVATADSLTATTVKH